MSRSSCDIGLDNMENYWGVNFVDEKIPQRNRFPERTNSEFKAMIHNDVPGYTLKGVFESGSGAIANAITETCDRLFC